MIPNKTSVVDWVSGLSEIFLKVLGFNNCTNNGVLGSPRGLVLGRDTGGCPPYVSPRSLLSGLSGLQAAPFNIISLHPQLPPCLLGRLNSQQRQPLHLTVSVS